jgi:hypothetical protein
MFKSNIFNIKSLVSIIISISDVAVSFCINQTQVISLYIKLYMEKVDFWHVNDITCVWLLHDDTATSDIDIMILISDSILNIIGLNVWIENY